MAGAFGHEIAKVPKHFSTNFFIHVVFRLLEIGLEDRVEVLAPVAQLQEPRHVVDARRDEINLLFRCAGITADEVHRRLDAVAQPDKLQTGNTPQRPATHGHGIRVIEENRVGTEFLHVARDFQQCWDVAQSAKYTARPHGISNALVHSVPQGDLIILSELLHPARLQHHYDVIRALKGFPAISGGDHCRLDPVVVDHSFHETVHFVQAGPGKGHQPVLASLERRSGEKIRHQGLAENEAARANHRDLCHISGLG